MLTLVQAGNSHGTKERTHNSGAGGNRLWTGRKADVSRRNEELHRRKYVMKLSKGRLFGSVESGRRAGQCSGNVDGNVHIMFRLVWGVEIVIEFY